MAIFCDYCGKSTAKYRCEICGAVYCRECESVPDEGGWNCPDEDCPGFGVAKKRGTNGRL